MSGIILAAFALQIVTATSLIKSGFEDLYLISTMIIVFACCFLVVSLMWTNYLVRSGREKQVEEGEYRLKIGVELFYHPIDKKTN